MAAFRSSRFFWLQLPPRFRNILRSVPAFDDAIFNATKFARYDDAGAYSEAYFEMIERTSGECARTMAASLVSSLQLQKLVDVGCGSGVLMGELRLLGVEVLGYDNSNIAIELCRGRGLQVAHLDLISGPRGDFQDADTVVCLEVLNLIPEEHADRCLDQLCSAGRTVVFSAGRPRQGGAHVRNEQSHDYWVEKFMRRGFAFEREVSQSLRLQWQREQVRAWFAGNVMVFKRVESGET